MQEDDNCSMWLNDDVWQYLLMRHSVGPFDGRRVRMHCEQAGAAQSVVSLVVEGGVSSGGRQNGNRTHITAMITAAESSAHVEQGLPMRVANSGAQTRVIRDE